MEIDTADKKSEKKSQSVFTLNENKVNPFIKSQMKAKKKKH